MSIRYYIRKGKVLDKTMNIGRVNLKGSFNREMLIDRMLEKGSGITRANILSVLDNLEQTVKNICLEGNKVTIEGFMQFTPSISGKFDSENDSFSPAKNEVYITAQISTVFNKDFAQKARVEKVIVEPKKPMLIEVLDVSGNQANTVITKNGIITISGENLKFNSVVSDEYLRFINENDPKDYVDIIQIQKLTNKKIVFLFPETNITEGYFIISTRQETSTLKSGRTPFTLKVIRPATDPH